MRPDGSNKQPIHLPADLEGMPAVQNLSWSPREGKIAFLHWNQVLVADLESGITRIVYHARDALRGGPIWNHRGDAILFVDGQSVVVKPVDEDALYLVGLENGRERWEPFSNLAFSADDQWVYFRNGEGMVVAQSNGRTAPKSLIANALYFNASPKGNYFAVYVPNDGLRILTKACIESEQVQACAKQAHRITSPDDETSAYNARWSQDEARFITWFGLGAAAICNRIAERCDEFDPNTGVWLGNNPWSPAGTKLVFSSLVDGGMTPSTLLLYDLNLASSTLISGFENGYMKMAWEASWSPNGMEH